MLIIQIAHSEWRKQAKKARRKRVRQTKAKIRDAAEEADQKAREADPKYQQWLEEQRQADEFQAQEEARQSAELHAKWLKTEEEAQKQWQELQKRLAAAREERAIQNAKIRLEWEKEQQRLKEIQEEKEKELEEKRALEIKRQEEINDFVANGGDTPEHLKHNLETNPNKQICPFFQKTSTCRFFDVCSRNHIRPAISRTILIPNFYTHYSLAARETEHGSDSNLEFEHKETYEHFREFFFDVVVEMEKCGKIRQFKVCCNHEPHLRGNVYVEYSRTSEALKSFQVFNGRWYGGRQLNVEFCNIVSWKTAICGMFYSKRCPKGNACNFLHVFRNPGNTYTLPNNEYQRNYKVTNSRQSSERSNWRWSESPERLPAEWESNGESYRSSSRSRRSKPKENSTRRRKSSRESSRTDSRSRSRSPQRKKRKRSESSSSSSRSYKCKV